MYLCGDVARAVIQGEVELCAAHVAMENHRKNPELLRHRDRPDRLVVIIVRSLDANIRGGQNLRQVEVSVGQACNVTQCIFYIFLLHGFMLSDYIIYFGFTW